MQENAVAKAIFWASVVIGLSIVLGCFMISRAPHFEKMGDRGNVFIETRTGSIYERTTGTPNYRYVPGPKASGSRVEPVYDR